MQLATTHALERPLGQGHGEQESSLDPLFLKEGINPSYSIAYTSNVHRGIPDILYATDLPCDHIDEGLTRITWLGLASEEAKGIAEVNGVTICEAVGG
jgi:predicted TIM-barrel fold metal-dependent hydrolase